LPSGPKILPATRSGSPGSSFEVMTVCHETPSCSTFAGEAEVRGLPFVPQPETIPAPRFKTEMPPSAASERPRKFRRLISGNTL
jgi:hypothetical protein